MKLGTLVHHVSGYKMMPKIFLTFAQGLKYGLSKSKNGVKSSLNFERPKLSPGAKIKKLRRFVDLPFFFFRSVKTVFAYRNSLKC